MTQLLDAGYTCRCSYRPTSDRDGFPIGPQLEWVSGQLNEERASRDLVQGCQAVIHAAPIDPVKASAELRETWWGSSSGTLWGRCG